MSRQILIIEDDSKIVEAIRINVEQLGISLDVAEDGETGLQKALDNTYALILLDLMLPKLGGMEICKRLREQGNRTPIIMLTAKGDELDRVMGLELGADDYLTKPFSVRELLARINAQLRRQGWQLETAVDPEPVLSLGRMTIDLACRSVEIDGKEVELTSTEFDVLAFLAKQPGMTFTRMEILENVWETTISDYEGNVNSLINRLRNKVERDPSAPEFVRTVRGYGYRFAKNEELESQ